MSRYDALTQGASSTVVYSMMAYRPLTEEDGPRGDYAAVSHGIDKGAALRDAREINQAVFDLMKKPGMERVVPNELLAVGLGRHVLLDSGKGKMFGANWETGVEGMMEVIQDRLTRYGQKGLLGVNQYNVKNAVDSHHEGKPESYQGLAREIARDLQYLAPAKQALSNKP